MGTRMTYRTSHRPFNWMATTLKDWMAHVRLDIGMAATTRRHRMGSWEEFASFRGRALSRKSEKDASTL